MRILGVDLAHETPGERPGEHTLVLLDARGEEATTQRLGSLPAVAAAVGRLAGGEPFLLGVNVPVVVPGKSARARPVENLIRRRFGYRMPAGGRASPGAAQHGVAGETLMAGLAAAGHPCLPYPDRDRRQPGLAEAHPALILKTLLWASSPLASSHDESGREELFRAYAAPAYRASQLRARAGWAEQAVGLDIVLSALGGAEGFDLPPVREALGRASTAEEVERAAALLDALLIAGTARRYLEAPETCLFLGDQEGGYVILPADGFVRRLALAGARDAGTRLFPQASLRERLGAHAQLRSMDLLNVPGRPQRTEAGFKEPPRYEFDNLDEMLWWKHCRHVAGPMLPTDGLREMSVAVGPGAGEGQPPLKLLRSRHRTLSFRFEPPSAWRAHVPTRDGKTYPFQVLRAVYETVPAQD